MDVRDRSTPDLYLTMTSPALYSAPKATDVASSARTATALRALSILDFPLQGAYLPPTRLCRVGSVMTRDQTPWSLAPPPLIRGSLLRAFHFANLRRLFIFR